MFDPTFYRLNESFDSNLTNYTAFDLHYDYVLRFILDGWEPAMPDGNRLLNAAKAVAKILAQTGDLAPYDVKAVIFNRAPLGEKVGYYSPSWYSMPWGSGYTDELVAGDGTWSVDLVFRPKASGRSWTDVSKWTQLLAGDADMVSSRGVARVFCAGLITLDPNASVDADVQVPFVEALTFWSGRHAFWEVFNEKSEGSPTGLVAGTRQINKEPPMLGWNMIGVGQIGHDGLGVAQGSAFSPYTLAALTVAGTMTPGSSNSVITSIDPATGLPKVGETTWQTLSTREKAAGVAAGVWLAVGLAWLFNRLRRDY